MVVQTHYWKDLNSSMLKRQGMNGTTGKTSKNIPTSSIHWIQITARLVKELVQYMNIIVCGVIYCYLKELHQHVYSFKFNSLFFVVTLQIVLLQEDDEVIKKLDKKSSSSKLPKAVQDLVCLIFDVESMKKAMMEFEVCYCFALQIVQTDQQIQTNSVL